MNQHFKLALVGMFGVFIMALSSSFLLTGSVLKDAKQEKQSFVLQIRKAVRANVESDNEHLVDQLSRAIEKESLTAENGPPLLENDFLALALLRVETNQASGWTVDWLKSRNDKIKKEWMTSLLASWPLERIKGDEIVWVKASTDDKQVYFLVMSMLQTQSEAGVENKISVGVVLPSYFTKINLITKSEKENVVLVDGQGMVFSHPDQRYIGTKVSNEPIVASLIKSQATESVGSFRNAQNESLIGGFEKISNSNLYVVATSPITDREKTNFKFMLQAAIVCLGLMALVAIIILYLAKKEAMKYSVLLGNLELMKNNVPSGALSVPKSDAENIEFSKAVAAYLSVPISNIVGSAQIVSDKAGADVKATSDKIISESRRISEFLIALKNKISMSDLPIESVSLGQILSQVVAAARPEITKQNIQFDNNIASDVKIKARYEEVKFSIKTVFTYTLQMLSEVESSKKLQIHVEKNGGVAKLVVEIFGLSFSAEQRKSIFAPFQARLKKSECFGLDMSLAEVFIQANSGRIEFENIGGQGCRFQIYLPIAANIESEVYPIAQNDKMTTKPFATKNEQSLSIASSLEKSKVVDDKKLFPPAPGEPKQEITISQRIALNIEPEVRDAVQPEGGEGDGITIRKPKVRFDI